MGSIGPHGSARVKGEESGVKFEDFRALNVICRMKTVSMREKRYFYKMKFYGAPLFYLKKKNFYLA